MNNENCVENLIESLLESKSWYIISPFHCVYDVGSNFDELEKHLLETYSHTFSDKISMILSKLICLYSAYIELIEFYPQAPHFPFDVKEYENIRYIGLNKIVQIIKTIIIQGGTSMNIYFSDLNSLIQISSGFDTVVFSENQDFLHSIDTLVSMEGLFIRRNI